MPVEFGKLSEIEKFIGAASKYILCGREAGDHFKRQNETSSTVDSADDDEILNLKKQYEDRIARLS